MNLECPKCLDGSTYSSEVAKSLNNCMQEAAAAPAIVGLNS